MIQDDNGNMISNSSDVTISCNDRDDEEIRFIQAIKNDDYSLVELLIQNGVNVNCIDNETDSKHRQYSALIVATKQMIQMDSDTITPDSKNCFDLIVSHPTCNVNYQDADGNTALHYSSSVRNWWTLFRLIKHGACDGQH